MSGCAPREHTFASRMVTAETHDDRLPSATARHVNRHPDEMTSGRDAKDCAVPTPRNALQAVVRAAWVELDKMGQRRTEERGAVNADSEETIRSGERSKHFCRLRIKITGFDEARHAGQCLEEETRK